MFRGMDSITETAKHLLLITAHHKHFDSKETKARCQKPNLHPTLLDVFSIIGKVSLKVLSVILLYINTNMSRKYLPEQCRQITLQHQTSS